MVANLKNEMQKRSDLSMLEPGMVVTLVNDDPVYTGPLKGEVVAGANWAGGWHVGNISRYALEFQGWKLA
jgi:hypothetical protein